VDEDDHDTAYITSVENTALNQAKKM